jgi:mono/diheme cytochrome c family protein
MGRYSNPRVINLVGLTFGAVLLGLASQLVPQPLAAAGFDNEALYRSNCAPCHGVTGMGGGPVASSLVVLVPQLATLSRRHDGQFPTDYVYEVVDGRRSIGAHGSQLMPVWGTILDGRHSGGNEEESTRFVIEAIVEHIKQLQLE